MALLFFGIAGVLIFFSLNDPPAELEPREKRVTENKAAVSPVSIEVKTNSTNVNEEKGDSLNNTQVAFEKGQQKNIFYVQDGKEKGILAPPLVGEVKIYDGMENEIASIASGVLSGGMVALPRRACLGGVDWNFFPYANLAGSPIIDGIWNERDEVGLWRIEGNGEERIALAPWDSSLPLSWLSLHNGRLVSGIMLRPEWNQGDILPLAVPKELSDPGLFIQQGNAVGWTFGDWLEGGYVWNRSVPSQKEFRTDISRFYDVTFAGGREEQFAKAILMEDGTPPGKRLQAFLAGVLLPAKLTRNDTPERLYVENVINDIRYLAQMLRHHGEAEQLAALVDEHIIAEVPDVELLKITVSTIAESGDYAEAVRFLEDTAKYFTDTHDVQEVRAMLLILYRSWLSILLEIQDIDSGWRVFRASAEIFPEDPELHLVGVELALLKRDWETAEELLYQREYPVDFRQRVAFLADKVSDLKSQEGKIVIRFSAGSSHIPVVARVNDRKDINFLVDTGATTVTVPVVLLDSLGIKISSDTPRRMVATAGGITEAWVVGLSSIELGGWVVYDLEALAIDIPSQNYIGLLGINFLEKFRMDLNTEKGILLLEPL